MRPITFTRFKSAYDREGVVETRPWDEWIEILTAHEQRGTPDDSFDKEILNKRKNGPALIFGECNKTRAKKNITEMHAFGIDVDGHPESKIHELLAALKGLTYVVYSTHKHKAEAVGGDLRFRFVIPFKEPVPAAQWKKLWPELTRRFLSLNDPATKDASRLNFLPSTYDPKVAVAFSNKGELLDPFSGAVFAAGQKETQDVAKDVRLIRRNIRSLLQTASDAAVRAAARKLSRDEPFADEGGRHEMILAITWHLAARRRNYSLEAVLEVFRPAIIKMQAEDSSAPGIEDVERCYLDGVERIEEEDRDLIEGNIEPYSEEELIRIADVQGCTIDELNKRWILQRDVFYYFLTADGTYSKAYSSAEARGAAVDHLARSPVQLMTVNSRGGLRRVPIQELAEDHGRIVRSLISDLRIQASTFNDKTRTLVEAVCPQRNIKPEYNEHVDEWLRLLGGDQADKLLDWVACVPDLNKLLCALYLAGPPGGGKTLLAKGLARIWTYGGPAEFERILNDFNEELAQCPIVLGDEELPRQWKGTPVTAKIRTLIAQQSCTLSRKFKAPTMLLGSIRLVLAANNEFLLSGKGSSTKSDLQAIAQRFLFIETNDKATAYLEALPKDIVQGFINQDKIAAHALHLAATREVARGKRFWVEGDSTAMHRKLLTGTEVNSQVLEWLVRYLMEPHTIDRNGKDLVRRGDGRLLVNDQALIDDWQIVSPHQDPSTRKIGAALRSISMFDHAKQLRSKGKRIRYRVIDPQFLFDWAAEHNIGDERTIQISLDGGNPSLVDENVTDDIQTLVPRRLRRKIK